MNATTMRLAECNIKTFIEIQNAYFQCDPEIQKVVDDMLQICRESEADEGEKSRALATIMEAIFPSLAADIREIEELVGKTDAGLARERQMDKEEEGFSQRLRQLMEEKGLTQEQLAEATGVGQPAISNMLNRRCRPQQRTVAKFAEALDVSPKDLWPET